MLCVNRQSSQFSLLSAGGCRCMLSFLKLLPQQLIPERSVCGIPQLWVQKSRRKGTSLDAHTLLMFCVAQQRPRLCQNTLLNFCKNLLPFPSADCATLPRPPQNTLNFPFQCQPGLAECHQWSMPLPWILCSPLLVVSSAKVCSGQVVLPWLLLQSGEINYLV